MLSPGHHRAFRPARRPALRLACRHAVSVPLCLLLTCPLAADSFREDFNQAEPGPTAPTRFSVLSLGLNAGIAREATGPGLGVPATGGVLPVDEGGDAELRFFEALEPGSSSFVLTPETSFADLVVDGYVGVGFTDPFGARTGTILARATGTTSSTLNAYGAQLNHILPGDTARLSLTRIRNGILENLVSGDTFPVSTTTENYRVVLRIIGDALSASVLRVREVGGERVEELIDLDSSAAVQTELIAVDGELASGAVGMRVFTRSTNSVLFDDVSVLDVIFIDGFEGGDLSLWSATVQ